MTKSDNETYRHFVKRANKELSDGNINLQEWCTAILGEPIYGDENLRRCANFFDRFIEKADEEDYAEITDDDKLNELEELKKDIILERKRLQTTNSELQTTYRNHARSELFNERLYESICRLEPLTVKKFTHNEDSGTTGLLVLSDFHCGSDYTIYSPMIGGKQEILNQYNFQVMEDRLWNLLAQVEADDLEYSDLCIAFLGDFFENVLRISSLAKIKEPVVDTVIKFSNFICVWLTEVYNRLQVPMTIVTVGGNHDEISYLQQGDRIKDENLAKIVVEFMKIRLKDIDGITVKPYSDASIETIRGTNILFNHGEDKDLKTTLEYFSNTGMVDVDEVIAGHLHHPENKTVGIADVGDKQVTRVGSICGVDAFSKRCRSSARPSAYMAMYSDEGKTWSRNYYLG